MQLTGESIIGFRRSNYKYKMFRSLNPGTGMQLAPDYFGASLEEVEEAIRLAAQAFASYGRVSGRGRAEFLRTIAKNVESLGDPLIDRATQETALPAARIKGEIGRTCFQLRLFADVVEEGSWVDARIDRADSTRQPSPKPDIRSLLRPLGPVVVFGASNFPIAFSVAGGDTVSALAAGNPVIVKAHPAHPGTSELAGTAILDAARSCRLPEGVFSLLFDAGFEVGEALVRHPAVKAVGFTGSRAGGRALMKVAAARMEPIPFYAEMSSVNPVFILPGAMRDKGDQIAAGLHGSVTMGVGQFCTNPGLVILEAGADATMFAEKVASLMASTPEFTMLTPGIATAYRSAIDARSQQKHIKTMVREVTSPGPGNSQCRTALFMTDAPSFLSHPEWSDEIFGPTTLLVMHSAREEMLEIASHLEGHLTATLHGTEEDLKANRDLVAILETKVGRLLFNGFPTGVEVCHAMVHGGPFPATSDSRTTSVGTRAITRFARPVCYQNFPDAELPEELQNKNPLDMWRMIDGQLTKDPVS